jgi:hypothetical protein
MRDAFYARTGAFVRLTSTRGRRQLRGSAGAYRSNDQLGHAIVEAAIQAASGSSCGSEVKPPELSNLNVSVFVVSDVRRTTDPANELELGRHGIAVEDGPHNGWLYPTIPVENGWSVEEYLTRVCRKAKLSPFAWQDDSTAVTLVEGQVFRERGDGSVEELYG